MTKETLEITIEKKVWEVPSLDKIELSQTFGGGSGDEMFSEHGPNDQG
jgi:hypothetical protein